MNLIDKIREILSTDDYVKILESLQDGLELLIEDIKKEIEAVQKRRYDNILGDKF